MDEVWWSHILKDIDKDKVIHKRFVIDELFKYAEELAEEHYIAEAQWIRHAAIVIKDMSPERI